MATTRMSHDDRSTQLLDVAERCFTERGYDRVSIEDIARNAGVSRPVVYQHFGSKEGLFLACALRAREEFQAELYAAHLASDGDLAAFVERGGELLFDLLHDRPSRWALLFSGAVGESGELAGELSRLRFGTVDLLAQLAGEYAPGLPAEELKAFANGIAGVSDAMCRWSLHEPEIPRQRILGYYRDFITSTIMAAQNRANERMRVAAARRSAAAGLPDLAGAPVDDPVDTEGHATAV